LDLTRITTTTTTTTKYYYCCCISGKAAVQNGTVSGQTVLDHTTEMAAVNGTLTSDGEVPAAVIEEDAVVRIYTVI